MNATEHALELQRYRDFAPTGFDGRGSFLDDRQDWLVAPVSRTRDSDALAESNFAVALEMLGGESESVEVHRFGHWGPGWFEIVLVGPGSDKIETLGQIACSLADYPVLNESDWGEREAEAVEDSWGFWGRREFINRVCQGDTLRYPNIYDALSEGAEDFLRYIANGRLCDAQREDDLQIPEMVAELTPADVRQAIREWKEFNETEGT